MLPERCPDVTGMLSGCCRNGCPDVTGIRRLVWYKKAKIQISFEVLMTTMYLASIPLSYPFS
jgi:hypothetical protein